MTFSFASVVTQWQQMLLMIIRLHQGHSMIFSTGCSKKVFVLFFAVFSATAWNFKAKFYVHM